MSKTKTISAVIDAGAEAEKKEIAGEDEVLFDLEAARQLAHAENVEARTDAISAYFSQMGEPAISLKSLQQTLGFGVAVD
jgi:hypothetical protein